jgi:hypothetical protein
VNSGSFVHPARLEHEVAARAALILDTMGPDVDEALCRYEQAGSNSNAPEAAIWISVAFALGRFRRFGL